HGGATARPFNAEIRAQLRPAILEKAFPVIFQEEGQRQLVPVTGPVRRKDVMIAVVVEVKEKDTLTAFTCERDVHDTRPPHVFEYTLSAIALKCATAQVHYQNH